MSETAELPYNPVAFALTAMLVLPLTRGRNGLGYFPVAWLFVGVFALMGLLGDHIPAAMTPYLFAQRMLKIWISIIGVPWLAVRVLNHETFPKLVKLSVLIAAFGAVLAGIQVQLPGLMHEYVMEPGRGAGFWVNPNNCGAVCSLFLFASLLYPFRSKYFNYTIRLILVGGVLASLSRGSVVMLLAASVVYGVASGRLATLIKAGLAILGVCIVGTAALTFIGAQNEAVQRRVERLQNILSGQGVDAESSRLAIWRSAVEGIGDDWLLGRGHGAMERVVKIGSGLGPHNYYLYVLGNSGILALLAFFAWLAVLCRNAIRCRDRVTRASLLAMTSLVAGLAMFDHALLANQFLGPVFAVMAIAAYYGKLAGQPQYAAAPYAPAMAR